MKSKKLKRTVFALLLFLLFSGGLAALFHMNRNGAKTPYSRTFGVMGTVAEIKFYGSPDKNRGAAEKVADVFAEVERALNLFDPESELSKLNATAYEKPFVCSDILWDVLVKGEEYYKLSDGAFDVTSKPLMDLWGFYRKVRRMPSEEEIAKASAAVGFDNVFMDHSTRTVRFRKPGVEIDLGGIAKGYAVDLAKRQVELSGVHCGIINIGGNLVCLEEPPPERMSYRVGIRHPRKNLELCGVILINDAAFSTSGDYERYVEIDGRRFSHVMDPVTGRPVEKRLSVTVVAGSALDTDAVSTAVFVRGRELAAKILKERPGTSILIIEENEDRDIEVLPFGKVFNNLNLEL